MYNRKRYYKPRPRYQPGGRRTIRMGRFITFLAVVAAIIVGVVLLVLYFNDAGPFKAPEPEATATPAPTPAPTESPAPGVDTTKPHAVSGTQPEEYGFQTDVMVDGQIVSEYNRTVPINMPDAAEYTALKGITTFRGNNYRNTASWGTVDVSDGGLAKVWDVDSGSLTRWMGSGWTGQPLIVQWDADMINMMNIRDDKKAKEGLVEVIYPTMDGKIYFLDLEDGSYTRDPIDMGVSIKGTASIDPRGYPLLYVGQGVGLSGDYSWDDTYMYIYSLIDGQMLWKYGAAEKDEFAHREVWQAYDSSPLVAADADTLIWPGENGILYTIVLNSSFDRAAGAVSVTPSEPVKYRYITPQNTKTDEEDARWLGMENSAVVWKNYAYFTDNSGWFQCVDLNTMELVLARDLNGDTDSSLVFEPTEDRMYLYTGCSVDVKHASGEEVSEGTCYIRKLDALTGEVIWEQPYTCYKKGMASGGVYATPLLGTGDLEGLVIYTIARTGGVEKGTMVAFNKENGEVVWQQEMKAYSWSSPVAVYTSGGKGYIIQCDSNGDMTLHDGLTGAALDKVNLGENVEASPSVFGNMVVVGTKGEKIYGVRIE